MSCRVVYEIEVEVRREDEGRRKREEMVGLRLFSGSRVLSGLYCWASPSVL